MSLSIGIAVSVAAALLISRRTSFHLQSASVPLFLRAATISAWFDESGMGFRISRSIIESHGGRLGAADQSPCGASSHVTLPTIIEAGA
ncbi:MAG: hypothetical protein WCC87_25440 [Candidatus Korobacteraceae bacterium]